MKISASRGLSMTETLHQSDDYKKKLLMLTYNFPPFWSTGGSIRVVKFTKYLPTLGWLPVVLTIDDSKEYDTQRKEGSESLLRDIPEQVKIYRTGAGEPSLDLLQKGREARRKNIFLALVVNLLRALRQWVVRYLLLPDENITWLPSAVRMGRQIVREENIDVIFVSSPPHSTAIIGAVLKRLTGKFLILDFRDDWIDTPSYNLKPRFIRWIERWMEKCAVRACDRLILVTEWSMKSFSARYPREPEDKFVYISNGCDLDDFRVSKRVIKRPHDSKFNIVHTGLMSEVGGHSRNPEPLLQAILCINKSHPEIAAKIRVVLAGRLPQVYRDTVDAMGLSDVVNELGFLPHDECIRLMTSADLLLAINSDDIPTAIPGKIYEYWAVGGPPILLLSYRGAAQDLVDQYKLGITASPYDTESIQHAILNVYHRCEAGIPLRVSIEGIEEFDRKVLTQKLTQTLSTLVGATHP
jgi:glycosyltransferase involved in cell wall biosynthesis